MPVEQASVMHYAFVVSEARQFLRSANLVQYVEGADAVEQRIEFCDDPNFRRRICFLLYHRQLHGGRAGKLHCRSCSFGRDGFFGFGVLVPVRR